MRDLDVYDKLVADEIDVVGHVAYSIYMRAKQDFIKRRQLELGLEILPDDIMEEFTAGQTDYILNLYRDHARRIIREFLEKDTKALQGEAIVDFANKFSPKSWWYGVAQSFVASFLFLLAGYAILKFSGSWDVLLNNLFR